MHEIIVVKMENSDLFEMVLRILFHGGEGFDNEIYKHGFSFTCTHS